MLSHRFSHIFGMERGQARRVRISGPFADQARLPFSYAFNVGLLGAKNKIKISVDGDRRPGGEYRTEQTGSLSSSYGQRDDIEKSSSHKY
jgi:hypothetical protein